MDYTDIIFLYIYTWHDLMTLYVYGCMWCICMDLCDAYDTDTCDAGCDAMWCSYTIYVWCLTRVWCRLVGDYKMYELFYVTCMDTKYMCEMWLWYICNYMWWLKWMHAT